MADPALESWRAMRALVLDHDRRDAVAAALDLSFARVRALLKLADGPATLRELARLLSTDPPYTTLIVDALEQRGFVVRTPDPRDRRAKLVTLTESGAAAAAHAARLLDEPPAALRDLPVEDVAALARILASARPIV
jgi:DNA-binding MarR family transcriptional regulator